MHPTLLSVFFSAAVSSATVALIKIQLDDPNYLKWVGLYSVFLIYRTKIFIDDLGWYADLKRTETLAHPADILFAILTWVGWFAMAAVIGGSLTYYVVFFIVTFILSSMWIYTADYLANCVASDIGNGLLHKLLRLKSRRHVRWFLINLLLIVAGFVSLAGITNTPSPLWGSQSGDAIFWVGFLIVLIAFAIDMVTNMKSFRGALQDASKL